MQFVRPPDVEIHRFQIVSSPSLLCWWSFLCLVRQCLQGRSVADLLIWAIAIEHAIPSDRVSVTKGAKEKEIDKSVQHEKKKNSEWHEQAREHFTSEINKVIVSAVHTTERYRFLLFLAWKMLYAHFGFLLCLYKADFTLNRASLQTVCSS